MPGMLDPFYGALTTVLANISDKVIEWALGLDNCSPYIDKGNFRFVRESGASFLTHKTGGVRGKLDPGETFEFGVFFCPDKPVVHEPKFPVVVNGDVANPFLFLTLIGVLEKPAITFDPAAISLTPVPLGLFSSIIMVMALSGYRRPAELSLHLPEVECEDGSLVSPLSVKHEDNTTFEGYSIEPCQDIDQKTLLTLKLKFECDIPLSFEVLLVFEDSLGNRYELPVTATSDNCLLTCYPFIAQHRMDHQIVCEEGKILRSLRRTSSGNRSVGEPIITNIATPTKSRPSTSATMSQFEVSSSAYESSEASSESILHDGGQRKRAVNKAYKSYSNAEAARRSLGSAVFSDEETEEGIFHQEVLYSIQRWFSANGWPGGAYPIRIPDSLRSGVTKQGSESKSKGGSSDANNIRKDLKTIYEMVVHLAGRPIPGIPPNGSPS
ncbi:CHDC2 [Bugula neritina]|uniref:CHDC2 n=1 Tax=Bugula neritina TaxID=10212 RepID=A0A7J7JP02_BUGNE|nr:CHDC2 [Bugula neritina]